ncbi:MAG TPA: DUF2934 domain-containing protein [Acidiferrobacterales bacterium]|nr:DUF2934 domain-containing protein [Acidiferrobacterales bacterium]
MAKEKTTHRRSATRASTSQDSPGQDISPDERRRMIEQAAYLRAEHRGFNGGDPMEDWLVAEREINRMLPSPQQQKQELAAYKMLREAVGKILGDAKEILNAEAIRQALAQATAQLKQVGEHTADTIDKVAASVEKDMVNAAQKIGTRWDAYSEKTADLFQVWRDRGNRFLTDATAAVGDWLQQTSDKLKTQTYHSGDMAASGTLECTACGEHLVLHTPAHLPACSKCRNMEFRRV